MTRFLLAFSAVALFACTGCNGNSPDPNVPPAGSSSGGAAGGSGSGGAPAAAETVVHVEDDGKTFDVAAGSTVTFKLAGNAGTGFMWKPNGVNAAVLAQQGDVSHETAGPTPGAPNADVYHFQAVAPGSTPVEMDYARPWEHGAPGKAIHVTVNVH
jgi:inhibitor of cysteine peptidase